MSRGSRLSVSSVYIGKFIEREKASVNIDIRFQTEYRFCLRLFYSLTYTFLGGAPSILASGRGISPKTLRNSASDNV